MTKKSIAAVLLTLCLLTGCTGTPAEETAENTRKTEETVAETTGDLITSSTDASPEITTAETSEPVHKEPDTLKLSSYTRIYFYRDDLRIYGQLFLPEGEGPFPVVILSTGFPGSYKQTEVVAKKYVENGIAGVVFDFTGSGDLSLSDGSPVDVSVLTEAADLNVVMDGILSMPEIDRDNVFLWGHSLGGLASTYVSEQRPDDIKGLILVDPSFRLHDQYKADYPDLSEIPEVQYGNFFVGRVFIEDLISLDIYEKMDNYDGNVILFPATLPGTTYVDTPEYFERAAQTFPSMKIEAIEGANHLFSDEGRIDELYLGQAGLKMTDKSIEFLKENIN